MKNITRFVFLFFLFNAAVYQTAQSQIIINNGGPIQFVNNNAIQNGSPDNNLIQTPRETIQRLKTAVTLMEEKRYSESVRILWDILRSEEDSFICVNRDKSISEEANEKSDENSDSATPPAGQTPQAAGPTSLISLKTYIQNILAQAPEEARQASELIVGTEAQKALEAAIQSGSLDRLLMVSRDYFHTEAGYKASFLSGLILLNDGQAASAVSLFDSLANTPGVRQKYEPAFSVLWLNSLILSGQDVQRRELVTQLRQRLARVDWTVEDKQITGFENLEQLEKYLAAFAEKTQNSDCPYPSAEPFTLPRWTAPTYTNPMLGTLVQTFIDNGAKSLSSNSNLYNAWMSSFEPVVSGNRVFFRTAFGLTAVDLQTGKRLWDSSADFSSEIQRQWDRLGEYERKSLSQFLYSALVLRSKYDFTYGALRADENNVYAIEDIWKERIMQGIMTPQSSSGIIVSRSNLGSFTSNRLAAYDINTGKLKWHVGSATVSYGSGADNALDSTTFLGAPLIMDGKLFVIGETSAASVVFYELDSATGKVLWSQTLGDSQNSLTDRMNNLTPIYENGIIVCPISGSSLVCIDLRQRRLLWGFNTPSVQSRRSSFFIISNSGDFRYELSNLNNVYNSGSVQKGYQLRLMDNKAFFTPVQSSDTYVVNLSDGQLDQQFMSLKSQNSYIPLSVNQKEAVIMTPSEICVCDIDKLCQNQQEYEQVQAKRRDKEQQISKTSGEERQKVLEEYSKLTEQYNKLEEERRAAITTISFPDSSRVIGRAFEFGGSLFIPLSNKTLVEFSLSKRDFVNTLKAPDEKSFGTVSLFSDKVFSQNYDRLDCYDVKQFVENQLQNKGGDTVRTLLAAGYMAWENDDIEAAAKNFRSAADRAPKSCLPLLKALGVSVLKKDYSQFESLMDAFQPAFADEQGRLVLAQYKIESSLKQNKILDCLDTLEPIMDDTVKSKLKQCTVDEIEWNLSADRSVWIGSVLEKVYKTASDEQKSAVEQWAAKRLDVPKTERTINWLTHQLDFFRVLPAASELQKELYQAYVNSNMLPQAELVLRQQRLDCEANPERIAAAWAEQALLIQKCAPEDSAKIFKRLNSLYPNVACCNGKTADEYVKSLGESSPVYKEYSQNSQWPQNEIDIAINKETRQSIIQTGSDNKKLFANENVFLDGSTVRRSSNTRQNLMVFDRFGRNRMTLSPDLITQSGRIIYQRTDMNTEAPWHSAEHLFFISDRVGQMTAINFLVRPGLLWSKDFEQEKLGDEDQDPYVLIRKANQPDPKYAEVNKLSGVFGNIVFTQLEDGSFAALDAATGRTRWKRKLQSNESLAFVDDDYFYTAKNNKLLDREGNVFGGIQEVRGDRYSIYTGIHDSNIRLPYSRSTVTSNGVISIESIYDSATHKQTNRIKLCSVREQKILWELEADFNSTPVYLKPLNVLYRSNVSNGRVQIIDADTGRIIIDDVFEVMTQEERDKIVERVNELKKRIEEENKKYAEEEKDDPKKRDERIRRQNREGRTEDLLPESYNESAAKNFFDGIDVFSDGNPQGDFYLIVRSGFGYTRKQRMSCKQFSPTRGTHLPKAKIYKYDRDGKPLWKEPLSVNDQYFYFDLPSASPFLVLGCNRTTRDISNNSHTDYEFMFVDKATGQVWKYQGKNSIGAFHLVCDPDEQKIEVVISTKESLILSFTDKPIPADAPKEMPLYTAEEKAALEKKKAELDKEKEKLEKEKEAAGEDDPFDK